MKFSAPSVPPPARLLARPFSPLARPGRSAFTLIELLTVIAIIGILAAIIIPTVGKVRATAKNAECASKLREWGRAVILYANENKGNYTRTYWYDAGRSPYTAYFAQKGLQSTRNIRSCPADPTLPSTDNTSLSGKVGYVLTNGSIRGNIDTIAPAGAIPLFKAVNPSRLLLLTDGIENNAGTDDIYITSALTRINRYVMPLFDQSLAADTFKESAARHGGRAANGVFGDGSVRRITGTALGQNDTSSILENRTSWFQIY